MSLSWPPKDPDEYLDYQLNWAARLGSDVIVDSVWDVPAEIIGGSMTFTNTTTTIWLSGGATGESCTLTNHITTQGGRLMDQSVSLKIKTR